jgi:site-specific DNA recombinase
MPIALYARVSTERQEREQTIESQLSLLRAWAEAGGHPARPEHVFTDDGYSGSRLDRPGLDRLRDAAQDGDVTLVAVITPDRLARKYVYQVLLLEEFRRLGVEVVFVQRPIGDDPNEQLLLQIQGAVAEYERALLGERFRRGRLQKARAGHVHTSRAPYGYRYLPKRDGVPGWLEIDEAEAELVRLMYGWLVDERLTLRQVLKRLNFGPWLPRSGRKPWSAAVVHHILADPVYAGTAYGNRYHMVPPQKPRGPRGPRTPDATCRQLRPREEWIPISVPAIVGEALYQRAQEQLARNALLSWRRNTRHPYLLRCLLSCGTCGLAMFGRTYEAAATRPRRQYYSCRGKDCVVRATERACPRRPAKAAELDAAVWDHVCGLLQEPARLVAQFQSFAQLASQGDQRAEAEQRRLTARLERLGREERRLIDAYQAEVLSLEELAERRQLLAHRRRGLQDQREQAEQLRRQQARAEEMLTSLTAFCARVKDRLAEATFAERQALLQLLIERIIVGDQTLEIRHVLPLGPAPPSEHPIRRLRRDEVHFAALPARPGEAGGQGLAEPFVGIADHQPHPAQAAGDQLAAELQPERPALAGADGHPEHALLAGLAHAEGDHGRLADHPPVGAHLLIGGVEEDVRVGGIVQRPLAEGGQLLVQLAADAAHLALGDVAAAQGSDQVVHLAGADAVHVRLLDHRQQRPLDAAPRLEQRGEEAAGAQLRDLRLQPPHACIEGARAMAVAVGPALGRVLAGGGADVGAGLGLDQPLQRVPQDRLQGIHVGRRQVVKQVGGWHAVSGHSRLLGMGQRLPSEPRGGLPRLLAAWRAGHLALTPRYGTQLQAARG